MSDQYRPQSRLASFSLIVLDNYDTVDVTADFATLYCILGRDYAIAASVTCGISTNRVIPTSGLELLDPALCGNLKREKWQSSGRHRRSGVCGRKAVRSKTPDVYIAVGVLIALLLSTTS
jgi:hypothetical protein